MAEEQEKYNFYTVMQDLIKKDPEPVSPAATDKRYNLYTVLGLADEQSGQSQPEDSVMPQDNNNSGLLQMLMQKFGYNANAPIDRRMQAAGLRVPDRTVDNVQLPPPPQQQIVDPIAEQIRARRAARQREAAMEMMQNNPQLLQR